MKIQDVTFWMSDPNKDLSFGILRKSGNYGIQFARYIDQIWSLAKSDKLNEKNPFLYKFELGCTRNSKI